MKINFKKFIWQMTTLLGIVILLADPINRSLQSLGLRHRVPFGQTVPTVEASEVYTMFTCPCCGQPLRKEKPCCGAMTQMVDFIDQKTATGANLEDIILATAQEFGLDRLAEQSQKNSIKEKLLASAPADSPRITVGEVKKDLGEVALAKGIVSTDFTINNDGQTDLVIDNLSSSCGCTSASLIYKDTESPRFFMVGHGQENPDPSWEESIAPGDEAIIRVYYDPSVHPDLEGPVTRTVSIMSNDPVEFETKLTITLDQTKK
ncbi:hypothetical protein AUJ42_02495 [Candidatus Collierbacteria bacterium CG1_02_44_10]|uniref:DUF1573 domain-containing protein n=1 Tax=Candidatus Collierbacteria bacterium CG1_02_44_10 TaxID=1805087 RepID=A0A1J4RUA6_9BACT|nr:MAG: hypothetical protein AUJ42_02495 [Candidatus Collierbacteria bacterium CG1_02_44_10]